LWARAGVIYLFLPLIVFTTGWLKPWISIPLLALVAASVLTMVRSPGSLPRFCAKSLRDVIIILAGAVVFALLHGLWEGAPQSGDQFKHSLILGDLIERPWPVRYTGDGGGEYLCYGLGHYMVPAALGKAFGTGIAGPATFLWGALGLFLFFLGLGNMFGRHALPAIVLFLLCAGLALLWYHVKTGSFHTLLPAGLLPPADEARLMKLGLFSANPDSSARIFHQPQHGITGFLGGLLIYDLLVIRKRWTESAAVLAATFFWSPFTTLGLGVIGLAALVVNHRTLVFRPVIHLVSAFAVMIIMAAYYLPHFPIAEKGFIWDLAGRGSWFSWYVLFTACFVLLPAAAVFWLDWKHAYLGIMKPAVVAMTLLLLICPLYKIGYFGDLRMQISGPAFLFIALAMTKGLLLGPGRRRILPYLFLCGVFLAGSYAPLVRTAAAIGKPPKQDYRIPCLRKNGLNSIKDLHESGFDVTAQYLGRSDAPSALWLLKENHSNGQR
jgi:hypothetical protein